MCPNSTILGTQLFTVIRHAIARHRLDLMIEGVLSGLDLELIEQDEWLETFWWLERLTGDRVGLKGSGYKHEWSEGWNGFSKAMILLFVDTTETHRQKQDDRVRTLAEARFRVRFKWASVKPTSGDAEFSRANHQGFQEEMKLMREMSKARRTEMAVKGFNKAAIAFRLLKRYRGQAPLPAGAAEEETVSKANPL